jgi:23S rRNA (adenine2030-N6)-methyltransferase
MLAYRHAFHAGNHADVLKHIVLTRVLHYMNLKDKPYRFVDTHAGAGGYSLEGRYAQKKGEYSEGIGRLWALDPNQLQAMPTMVADYVNLVRRFNPGGGQPAGAVVVPLEQYPGSPALARFLLRPQDQMRLFELHPTDFRILESYMADQRGAETKQLDGFDSLKGQVPPTSRRALVLMDPSYEGHKDYGRVVATLREALERFAQGVYMVWYPCVQKLEAAQLPKRLEALAPKGWLHARLNVQKSDSQGFGLAGSGVFILNPPYTLHDELLEVLPYLVEKLGQYEGANYLLEQKTA